MKHNKNQPTTGESYDGKDNQFQQGSFSRSPDDPELSEALDADVNPGDAYTRRRNEGGIYNNEAEEPERTDSPKTPEKP